MNCKLTDRQKAILNQLIQEELPQLKDDVEDSPESREYYESLSDLEVLIHESNHIEVWT